MGMLDAAEEDAFREILQYLSWAGSHGPLVDEFGDYIYNLLNRNYNLHLNKVEFQAALRTEVQALYKTQALPRVNFTLFDQRAMTYLERSDLIYLGKYVNSAGVKDDILQFLKDAYIKGGRAIGNSPSELRAFIEAFKEQIQLTKWQARRIVDTTVNRSRNFGHLISYRQAAGKTFRISGPRDNLTCPFCYQMVGRTFSVPMALSDMDKLFNQGPEAVSILMPFLKGSITLDELKGATDQQLQEAGLALPPYHPVCRHDTVLDSAYEDLTQVPYSIE